MWPLHPATSRRTSNLLFIDLDEPATAALAEQLATRGAHVYFTASPHVGKRLSQEHYFDLVVIDSRLAADGRNKPALPDVIAREGHRCVVLSVADDRNALPNCGQTVRGAIIRPLDANRILQLALDVIDNASFDGYKHHLDVVR